jgi:acyl-CoA dehydrogenase
MSADSLVVETVERLLAKVSTQHEIEAAEVSGWSQPTWDALAEAGFPLVGIDESKGGSGGSVYDIAAVLQAVGRHAASVPLAETALLGGWLLAEAGLPLPEGPVTIMVPNTPVAWARQAAAIVCAFPTSRGGFQVVSLRPDQVTITPGANLAGEARDNVVINAPPSEWTAAPIAADPSSEIDHRGSLSRSIMAAGALAAVAQMTVDYAHQRRQFGKPVATFQAVQLHLVTVAQCAVSAQMAADVAVRAFARGDGRQEIAAARVIVDQAITAGTRAAHQAHGAMGVTREYPLHQLSRRLWSWRQEWGTTKLWRRQLGALVVEQGADQLFPLITSSS